MISNVLSLYGCTLGIKIFKNILFGLGWEIKHGINIKFMIFYTIFKVNTRKYHNQAKARDFREQYY